jgi:hypothetical protein
MLTRAEIERNSVKQLRTYVRNWSNSHRIKGYSTMKRAALVEAIHREVLEERKAKSANLETIIARGTPSTSAAKPVPAPRKPKAVPAPKPVPKPRQPKAAPRSAASLKKPEPAKAAAAPKQMSQLEAELRQQITVGTRMYFGGGYWKDDLGWRRDLFGKVLSFKPTGAVVEFSRGHEIYIGTAQGGRGYQIKAPVTKSVSWGRLSALLNKALEHDPYH